LKTFVKIPVSEASSSYLLSLPLNSTLSTIFLSHSF
jgi:hypothetical protein